MAEIAENDHDKEDELYSIMCRVISKRKDYPKLLMKLEEERNYNELKQLENATVDLGNDGNKSELKKLSEEIRRVVGQVPPNPPAAEAQAKLLKVLQNKREIYQLLEICGKRYNLI